MGTAPTLSHFQFGQRIDLIFFFCEGLFAEEVGFMGIQMFEVEQIEVVDSCDYSESVEELGFVGEG